MQRRAFALRVACCAVGLVLALSTQLFAQEEGGRLSVDEYVAQLEAAREKLLNGEDLSTVQQDLAAIDEVQREDGEIVDVTPILAGVDDADAALRRLAVVLAQMEESRQDNAAQRLAQLQIVRDRFDLDRLSFWGRFWRWVGDLLDALTPDRVPQGAGAIAQIGSRLVVWLIVLSGGLLIAILLSYWLRNLLGGILKERLRQRNDADGEFPVSAAEARSQAQTLAGAGNYRAAVRQLYLAALLHLDEQGLLRFQRDQTNREVLAQTKPNSAVHLHLKPAVDTFDRVWYGEREPDRSTFESYRADIDELMTQTAPTPTGDKRA